MLVENSATNTETERRRSQTLWWTSSRKVLQAIDSIVQHTISFSDSRATAEKESELHPRTNLPRLVSKCYGNCDRPIKVEKIMVVRSYGRITRTGKSAGKEKANFGPTYIHFNENCLKNFSETVYVPGQYMIFRKQKYKDTRKAYGSGQSTVVVIENEVSFNTLVFHLWTSIHTNIY